MKINILIWIVGFALVYLIFMPIKGDPFPHFVYIYAYIGFSLIVALSKIIASKSKNEKNDKFLLTIVILLFAFIFPLIKIADNGILFFVCNAARYNYPNVLNALLIVSDKKYLDNAFYCAIDGENIEIAAKLANDGADVKSASGNSIILLTCKSENYEFIKLLVERGIDPNERDSSGKNCLMLLIEKEEYNKSAKLIEYLLNNMNSLSATDNLNETALMKARKFNKNEVENLLIKLGAAN